MPGLVEEIERELERACYRALDEELALVTVGGLRFEAFLYSLGDGEEASREEAEYVVGFKHVFASVNYHCRRCFACSAEFGARIYKTQVFRQMVLDEFKKRGIRFDLEEVGDGAGDLYMLFDDMDLSVRISRGEPVREDLEAVAESILLLVEIYESVEKRFREWEEAFDAFRAEHEPISLFKYEKSELYGWYG